ncbi:MAG TPA: GNAT family N-acetyltransferase [Candidatus Binataceae bacterium]|nr:GNAT family N-acetyltransferase [Candidatus Binataceae bacterium]
MEYRAARPSERDEVLDLLSLWYGDREFFARYNQNDPSYRDNFCLIARDGGQLASTVQIFDRKINLAGQAVPMGGIGSVFTREDYRHKGVASELMRLAVETMRNASFEVSLLFAERITFYNQFGWREVERKISMLPGTERLSAPGNYLIDVFDPERDLTEVDSIHRGYSGRFNLTAARDPAAWSGSLKFSANQPLHHGEASDEYFILCRNEKRIVAYARVMRLYGVPGVMEFGYVPGARSALLSIFKYLGEVAAGRAPSFKTAGNHSRAAMLMPARGTAPAGIIASHTAHDPDLERQFAAAGSQVSYYTDNNFMWTVLAPEKLAKRLNVSPESATARAFKIFSDPGSVYWMSDRF